MGIAAGHGEKPASWPVRDGATCADCGGPVNAFGCASRCTESEAHRLNPLAHIQTPEDRLATIQAIARQRLESFRPEFVDREWAIVFDLAGGQR